MKICVSQIRPIKGDIEKNILLHQEFIKQAVLSKTDFILFPELSLTGYEPSLANDLATAPDDVRFDLFQKISDADAISIGVGVPLKAEKGITISMLVFQPNKTRQVYSKQHLHSDELPYFVEGNGQLFISEKKDVIMPAICYESLLPEHAAKAKERGATVYMASVAKSAKGVEKAYGHYPEIAREYSMMVCMSNSIGPSDNFIGAGQSAVWSKEGKLLGQLDRENEGILIFDTATEALIKKQF